MIPIGDKCLGSPQLHNHTLGQTHCLRIIHGIHFPKGQLAAGTAEDGAMKSVAQGRRN